jgi:AcrR family transcriptional regulator
MVEKKNIDRRITRTKSSLQQAFNELIIEKGYEAATIEDITARANIGRTTFYLHYQDKEDLLLEGLEEHLLEMVDEFNLHPLIFWFHDKNGNLIRSIFESIKMNPNVYRVLTQSQSQKIFERFKKIIAITSRKMINENPWAQRKVKNISFPIELLIEYFAGAMWSSIIWWVNNEFEPSADEMATSFRKLFFPGLLKVLNVKRMSDLIESL